MKALFLSRLTFFLFLPILFSGCYESTESYVLNPDGSGKVQLTVDAMFSTDFMIQEFDPDEDLRRNVRNILTQSKGIEAWSDIHYALTDEGRFTFSGTAYFKDFNAVSIKGIASGNYASTSLKKTQGMSYRLSSAKGRLRLAYEAPKNPVPESLNEELSKEEIEKRVRYLRVLFDQAWHMMGITNKDARQEKRFLLPGRPVKVQGFEYDKDSGEWVKMVSGDETLALIEQLVEEPGYWERKARLAGDPKTLVYPSASELYQLMERQGPLPDVQMQGPFEHLFDYEAEVAEARLTYEKVKARLRIPEEPPLAPPAQNQEVKMVEVVGTRFVGKLNSWTKMKPFKEPQGYEIAILVTMDGSILKVEDPKITSVFTNERIALGPIDPQGKIKGSLSHSVDRSQFLFNSIIETPPLHTRGFDEIKGTFTYLSASQSKVVTLGIMEMKEGAKLEAYNTTISRIRKKTVEGEEIETFDLRLTLNPLVVKRLYFYTEAGEKLLLKRKRGYLSAKSRSFSYSSLTPLPEKIRVDMEGYTDLQKHIVPFVIQDVDLLGRSLKR